MPESFFIFIHYDNLYLLTNIPYANIYLYFGIGIFFAKAWYCWLQPSLCIPYSNLGHCFFHDLHHQCSWDAGPVERTGKEMFLLTFSCFLVIKFGFFTRTIVKPHQSQNEASKQAKAVEYKNMINVKEYYRRQNHSHIPRDFLFQGSRAYHWLCFVILFVFFFRIKMSL